LPSKIILKKLIEKFAKDSDNELQFLPAIEYEVNVYENDGKNEEE
jgi:hypothetical protein